MVWVFLTVFPKSHGEQQSMILCSAVGKQENFKTYLFPISFIQQRKSQILTRFMSGILEWGAQPHFT